MATNNELGADGESVAAAWYERRGYTVVARNWRVRTGELDLVVAKGSTLVVCEVKTRTSARYGPPAAAVGARKQQRIRGLAVELLRTLDRHRPDVVRFDVAAVTAGPRGYAIEVIEHAF